MGIRGVWTGLAAAQEFWRHPAGTADSIEKTRIAGGIDGMRNALGDEDNLVKGGKFGIRKAIHVERNERKNQQDEALYGNGRRKGVEG